MPNQSVFLFLLSVLLIPMLSVSAQENILDEQLLASLERRAVESPERDQCYFYAALVHELVRYGATQYASGEVEKASTTLKHTQRFTARIRALVGANAKKLKPAQILLRRTVNRLIDVLHASRFEDRPLVQETLVQVKQAERDTLQQVLKK